MTDTLATYKNGNTQVTILTDGTKIREYEDGVVPYGEHPESIDIKISDYCDMGCEFCHESSTTSGKHGDLTKLTELLEHLPPGVEIACLDGDTNVFTPNGIVKIKDLSIDDFVYDENCKPVRIVKTFSSEKECIELSFTKGKHTKIICTEDHIFVDSDNNEVQAKDLIDVKMKIASFDNFVDKTIDLSTHITYRNPNIKSSRGGSFTDDKVRLSHVTPEIDRFITPDKDLMYLYGVTVAEGSRKGISLNINELDIAKRCIKIYKDKFNLDSVIYTNKEKKSLVVEFKKPTLFKRVFLDAMQIGIGARNISIKFLFGLDKELVRSALFGMFQGDGAFRVRDMGGRNMYNFTYKTSSKTLAEELNYILYTYFDVHSSLHYGINKERQFEGRTLPETDYHMIDIYGKENIRKLFPDLYVNDPDFNSVVKYTNKKTNDFKCNGIEKIGIRTVYDITLEDNSSHLFSLNNGIVTHNCGGGNPLSHPDLLPFLTEMKRRGIIVNLTVNQGHLKPFQDLLKYIITNDLAKGIGISISNNNFKYLKPLLEMTDNIVYHLIAGVNQVSVVEKLISLGTCKVLILGYKKFGFGVKYYNPEVDASIIEWRKALRPMIGTCTISFDNLAIEQLNVRKLFTDEGWEKFYMGDDFTFTMYIDAVKQQFAPTSRSSNRKPFAEYSLLEYFAQRNSALV